MKTLALFSVFVCIFVGLRAQELNTILLHLPDVKRGLPVMTALEQRRSTREYSEKRLELQDLSDLLWAAVGVNRPESGKRTAPSALNRQEIEVYVCLPEGAYRYDAKSHALQSVVKGDYRPAVAGGQDFVNRAPVCLVIVADTDLFQGEILIPAVDAGIVSQNISLFCAATGLVTVPRASMDHAQLKKVLKLKEGQRPLMNHPVGYAK